MPHPRAVLLAALALLGACTTRPVPPPYDVVPPAGEAPAGTLASSLGVEVAGDTVRFSLSVTNVSGGPVEITFPSGQTHDFAVLRDGRELWRWSADRAFTQAQQVVTLPPGGTTSFGETWAVPPGTSGELTAVGRLASSSHPVERTAAFRVP